MTFMQHAITSCPQRLAPALGLLAAALLPPAATARPLTDALTNALINGSVSLDARYRYELVDQASFDKDARASTVRTRLGYRSGDFHGFSGYIEAEDVSALGPETFNSTINGVSSRPVIADPLETEVNQAYLRYQAGASAALIYGRQRLALDNHRFIGTVGWRQNEQTFDAFTLVWQGLADTTLTLGHLSNANRVFSDASPNGNARMDTGVINARYDGFEAGSIAVYTYLLSFDDDPNASTRSHGLRFSGDTPINEALTALYTLEYARQSDYDDSNLSFDVDYYRLELGGRFAGVTLMLGQEQLGSDDGARAFQTPLATLHAMNGWTDRFLSTPPQGLEDTSVSIGAGVAGVSLKAVYHRFNSDQGDIDYGSEAGVLATWAATEHYLLGFKAARYSADDFSEDVDKLWLWANASF